MVAMICRAVASLAMGRNTPGVSEFLPEWSSPATAETPDVMYAQLKAAFDEGET
jgi:hypothetical protein